MLKVQGPPDGQRGRTIPEGMQRCFLRGTTSNIGGILRSMSCHSESIRRQALMVASQIKCLIFFGTVKHQIQFQLSHVGGCECKLSSHKDPLLTLYHPLEAVAQMKESSVSGSKKKLLNLKRTSSGKWWPDARNPNFHCDKYPQVANQYHVWPHKERDCTVSPLATTYHTK